MGTRSMTHFKSGKHVEARIYRHWDGYPEGAGADIKIFLDTIKKELKDTRFGDPGYLAAKYVVFLADLFHGSKGGTNDGSENDSKFNFLSVGIADGQDYGGIEYIYEIDCDNLDAEGFPTVKCYDVYDEKYVDIPAFKKSTNVIGFDLDLSKAFSGCKTVTGVKRKFKALAKQYHADKGGDDEIMKRINAAYQLALARVS